METLLDCKYKRTTQKQELFNSLKQKAHESVTSIFHDTPDCAFRSVSSQKWHSELVYHHGSGFHRKVSEITTEGKHCGLSTLSLSQLLWDHFNKINLSPTSLRVLLTSHRKSRHNTDDQSWPSQLTTGQCHRPMVAYDIA